MLHTLALCLLAAQLTCLRRIPHRNVFTTALKLQPSMPSQITIKPRDVLLLALTIISAIFLQAMDFALLSAQVQTISETIALKTVSTHVPQLIPL